MQKGRERYATMVPGKNVLIFANKGPHTGEVDRMIVVMCDGDVGKPAL